MSIILMAQSSLSWGALGGTLPGRDIIWCSIGILD